MIVVERRRAGHHGAQGGSVRQEGGSELRRVVEARLAKALSHDGVAPLGGEALRTDGPQRVAFVPIRIHSRPWPLQSEQSSKTAQKPPMIARISVMFIW